MGKREKERETETEKKRVRESNADLKVKDYAGFAMNEPQGCTRGKERERERQRQRRRETARGSNAYLKV